MSEKEQLATEVAFAAQGQLVLNNEAYKTAMTVLKAQIFETFCKTGTDQQDIREEAWRTMRNLQKLEDYFKTVLETGKMAEMSLKAIDDA